MLDGELLLDGAEIGEGGRAWDGPIDFMRLCFIDFAELVDSVADAYGLYRCQPRGACSVESRNSSTG